MLLLINKKNKILIYFFLFILLTTINNKSLETPNKYIINNTKIQVSGLSSYDNSQIIQQLTELLIGSIFFINEKKVKQVISQYNLVEKYNVKKIYPNLLNIEIEPTKFVAEIKGTESFLVGSNGKLINNKYKSETLPFLFGKFDKEKFLIFKKNVDASEFEFRNLKLILFYPSNRWDIQTNNGFLIKLPEIDLLEALNIAYKIINDDRFIANKTIDLRIANNIFIKNE